MSEFTARRSTTFPFPSSPHWAPRTTVTLFSILDFLHGHVVMPLSSICFEFTSEAIINCTLSIGLYWKMNETCARRFRLNSLPAACLFASLVHLSLSVCLFSAARCLCEVVTVVCAYQRETKTKRFSRYHIQLLNLPWNTQLFTHQFCLARHFVNY